MTRVTASVASAMYMLRKMVGAYSSHTTTIQRRVKPLLTPTKKFSVSPATIDMSTGTIRNAQTSSVKPSCR